MRTLSGVLQEWRRRGVKATPQRRAILETLLGDSSHPSAEAIYRRLRRKGVSFATVYNTLETMVNHGDLDVLRVNETMRFDPNLDPHHHAVCDVCGRIFDVPLRSNPRAQLPPGFERRRVAVEFRGVCKDCRRRNGQR